MRMTPAEMQNNQLPLDYRVIDPTLVEVEELSKQGNTVLDFECGGVRVLIIDYINGQEVFVGTPGSSEVRESILTPEWARAQYELVEHLNSGDKYFQK